MAEQRTAIVGRWLRGSSLLAAALLAACATAGSTWMEQPLPGTEEPSSFEEPISAEAEQWESDEPPTAPRPAPQRARTLGPERKVIGRPLMETPDYGPDFPSEPPPPPPFKPDKLEGKVLGKFRNTYYDFPNERDYAGDTVAIKNADCETIKQVPRPFFEAVCVQGSGMLSSGATISFNKRNCECAELCPRTEQRICFDELEAARFPWGRGATGRAITPLLTVAVDTDVVPMNTPIFIPEYEGVPRDPEGRALHDGCFIAQDRGVRIKGRHVDVFTGHESITKLWNAHVPSNRGVTVVVDSPRCARAID